MANIVGGMSRLAALSEAIRHLEAQTVQLDPQLRISVGDFDADSASAIITRAGRLMRQLHNASQPVACLPPEVLCMIFLALRDAHKTTYRNELGLDVSSQGLDRWMVVRQVSRAWRSVAMDYAPFWSTFRLGRNSSYEKETEKLSVLLARSKTSPLTIEVPYNLSSSALLQVLQNSSRLQRVRLRGALEMEHLELLATQDAPKLEALELYSGPKDPKSELPTLFNGVHPRLTTLALTGFTRIANNSFPDLKHLCMVKQEYTSLDEIERFLDLLQSLPKLEQLVFVNTRVTVDFSSSTLTTISHRAIVLSDLQRIIFMNVTTSFVNVILSAISVSPSQTVTVLLDRYSTSPWSGTLVDLRQLQGPGWEEVCSSTQKFSIIGCRDFVVLSAGRELRFTGWHDSPAAISRAFRQVLTHAREIWIRAFKLPATKHTNLSFAHELLPAFLSYAQAANAVYLDIGVPKGDSLFAFLHARDPNRDDEDLPQYMPVPAANSVRNDMELHVKIDSERQKAFSHVRKFREAVSKDDGINYISDIRVYASECTESLKLQKWSEKANANKRELNTHPPVHVVTDGGETFPKVTMSAAFSAPCPFYWDVSGYYRY